MKLHFLIAFHFVLALIIGPVEPLKADPVAPSVPEKCYVFSYFVDNGQDGLHLAWSRDGYHWQALNGGKSCLPPLGPGRLMRDPCLLLGPDSVFRMVWTDGWDGHFIGYACSRDLIHWTDKKEIPVMKHEPAARNSWAPEVHVDPATGEYLIFWSSTIPGKFPATDGTSEDGYNHRTYCTTTRDFVSFTPTRLFFDPGYSEIDATILQANGKFHLIYKNETLKPKAMKDLWIATSDTMSGPYGHITGPLPTVPPNWVEGPTALRVGHEYLLYFDCYSAGHYGALRSRDLVTWEDVTSRLSIPKGIRHGTALEVPGAIVAHLLEPQVPAQ